MNASVMMNPAASVAEAGMHESVHHPEKPISCCLILRDDDEDEEDEDDDAEADIATQHGVMLPCDMLG